MNGPVLPVAASRMTGVRCYLDVDADAVARTLAPLGFMELGGPTDRRVCCEIWRVTDGRVLIGGLEQHDWVMAAREMGRLAGTFWGASAGWAWGDFMAGRARDLTEWTVIEPYHELLFTVPDVLFEGSPDPVSVVLGMTTDLPLALKLDHIAYYGYDKQMSEFVTDGPHHWDVHVAGAPFLSARLKPTGRGEADIDRASAASGTVQPLLGGLRDRRPMLAELRRDLGASGEDLQEVEGTIEVHADLFPLPVTGRYPVRSTDAPANRVSLSFREVEAFVSYPRPVR